MGEPPKPPRPAIRPSTSFSADALDRLLDILARQDESIRDLSKKIANVQFSNEAVRSIRLVHGELFRRIELQAEQIDDLVIQLKKQAVEKSETDSALISANEGFLRALEEATVNSKAAAEGIAVLRRKQDERTAITRAVEAETKAQTPVLQKIETQTKLTIVPKAVVAINGLLGLIYLALEVFRYLNAH